MNFSNFSPRPFALCLLVSAPSLVAAAPAQPVDASGPYITYQVQPGDSIYRVAQRLLDEPSRWPELVKLNAVAPKRLPVGAELKVPAPWLKPAAAQARTIAVAGVVTVNGQALSPERLVGEGDALESGPNASATFQLPDGTIVTLTAQSKARFEAIRQYSADSGLKVRLIVLEGRAEASSPPARKRPFEIKTPLATAAVRGTAFRAAASGQGATTEVLQGSVQWGSVQGGSAGPAARRTSAQVVEKGFGSSASSTGELGSVQALLPAPDLTGFDAFVTSPELLLRFDVPGAVRYRVRVANDEALRDLVQETVLEQGQFSLATTRDGPYFVAIRGIARDRIEGIDASARIVVDARPIPPVPQPSQPTRTDQSSQALLAWQPSDQSGGPEVQEYIVQLADQLNWADAQTHRVRETRYSLSLPVRFKAAAASGVGQTIYWRVAAVDQNGKPGRFSAHQSVQWWAAAPAVELTPGASAIEVRWPAAQSMTYEAELAANPEFARARALRSNAGSVRFERLAPGAYWVRLRPVLPDGTLGQASAVARTQIRPPEPAPLEVMSTEGLRWQLGSGGVVERFR
jgi:hypothetical protein